MSHYSLSGQRKTTIGFLLPVQVGGVNFDITQAGVVVVFSVRRNRGDAAPLIQKTYRSGGGSDPGISASGGAGTNTLEIDVLPADTDPATYAAGAFAGAFTDDEFLVWDAIITEPSQRVTPIAKGALTVYRGAGP